MTHQSPPIPTALDPGICPLTVFEGFVLLKVRLVRDRDVIVE
jgi:hypothetical protein